MRTTRHSALVAAVILALTALGAPLSQADTGQVPFSCTFDVWTAPLTRLQGEGTATASFDTGIRDGLVAKVGQPVPFHPATGKVTLPDALTGMLRDQGVTMLAGEYGDAMVGDMMIGVDDPRHSYETFEADVEYAPWNTTVPVPAEGPTTVPVALLGHFTFFGRDAGEHTLVSDGFNLPFTSQNGNTYGDLTCRPDDGQFVLATVHVVAGPPTPPAPTGMDAYTCTLSITSSAEMDLPTTRLEWPSTASFDTTIKDGAVVHVGQRVRLNPFTGRIGLPQPFLDLLGHGSRIGGGFGGSESFTVAPTAQTFYGSFHFPEQTVPAKGPAYLKVTGTVMTQGAKPARFAPKTPGRYTLVGGSFHLSFDAVDFPTENMTCVPDDRPVLDTLTAVKAPTDPSTPVRPVVVQTDFAPGGPGVPVLPGLAALTALVAGAGWSRARARARARAASRQH